MALRRPVERPSTIDSRASRVTENPTGDATDAGDVRFVVPNVPSVVRSNVFLGSVVLGNETLLRDARRSVEEVIGHLLATYGAHVEVRLEIRAERPAGFDDDVVRAVMENIRQLHFDDGSGFRET